MSNLIDHAIREFRAAGWTDDNGHFKDEMQQKICNHLLNLLKMFADEGHSGTTAPYTARLFEALAMFKPIFPLTGEPSEWNEVGKGVFQNNRCGTVFRQADRFEGAPYDIDGYVFVEKNGSAFTCYESCKLITFPYVPSTEYIHLDENGHTDRFPNFRRESANTASSIEAGTEGPTEAGPISV